MNSQFFYVKHDGFYHQRMVVKGQEHHNSFIYILLLKAYYIFCFLLYMYILSKL